MVAVLKPALCFINRDQAVFGCMPEDVLVGQGIEVFAAAEKNKQAFLEQFASLRRNDLKFLTQAARYMS